jgi:hypothetical protein
MRCSPVYNRPEIILGVTVDKEEITQKDIKYLTSLINYIETWAYRHSETVQKLEIGKKITGFVGEALTFRELKKHVKIDCVWKGGAQGGYDIRIDRSKAPIRISVKTTFSALRTRGRGEKKRPYGYQWSLGWGDKEHAKKNPSLIFIFVGLNKLEKRPDFYIVPSKIIREHFGSRRRTAWPWPRYHPKIKAMQKYRGNWRLVKRG